MTAQTAPGISKNTLWQDLLASLILWGLGAGLMIHFLHGGILTLEMQRFFLSHLNFGGDKSMFQIVLDWRGVDNLGYTGRELTYFFGWIDARFVRLCAAWGRPHFMSLTHLVSVFAIVLVHLCSARRLTSTPWALRLGPPLLFLAAPVTVLSGFILLPGQILAAALLVPLLWTVIPGANGKAQPSLWRVFALAAPLPLLDRQGLFFILLIAALGVFHALFVQRRRRMPGWTAVLLVCAALAVLINRVIGPRVIHAVTGFHPDLSTQSIPWLNFFRQFFEFMLIGLGHLMNTLSRFFGNIGLIPALAATVLGIHIASSPSMSGAPFPAPGRRAAMIVLCLGALFAMSFMFGLMAFMFLPFQIIKILGIIRYAAPLTASLLVTSSLLLDRLLMSHPRLSWAAGAVLVFMAGSSILALPKYQNTADQSMGAVQAWQNKQVRQCLLSPDTPLFAFNLSFPGGAALSPQKNAQAALAYQACRALRSRKNDPAPAEIQELERVLAESPDFLAAESFAWSPDQARMLLARAREHDASAVLWPQSERLEYSAFSLEGFDEKIAGPVQKAGARLLSALSGALDSIEGAAARAQAAGFYVLSWAGESPSLRLQLHLTASPQNMQAIAGWVREAGLPLRVMN